MKPFWAHRLFRGLAAMAVGASLAVLLPMGSASAASPQKGGRYTGETSQGEFASVKIDRRGRIDFVEADITYPCGRAGSVESLEITFGLRVKRDGSFSQTFTDEFELDQPAVIEGTRRHLFSVAKNQVTGRFITSRKVTGTWRARNVLYDFDLFPDNSDPVDKCDTGVLNWTARLRR